MATIGRNMAAARKKRNMTRQQLAELMCMDPELIRDLEMGKVEPTEETLDALSGILDVPPETLLYGQSPAERRRNIWGTLLKLIITLGLIALTWVFSRTLSRDGTLTETYVLRVFTLFVYPLLALIAGRLLMRFIEALTRAAEHNDDPGHTQDRGLYAFIILVLLALSVIVIPYLLLQGVQDISFVSSRLPWSAVQAAQRITSVPVWSRVIYALDEFHRRIPLIYLVYAVLGSGLWASRPRKRKKLKKSGSYSIPS